MLDELRGRGKQAFFSLTCALLSVERILFLTATFIPKFRTPYALNKGGNISFNKEKFSAALPLCSSNSLHNIVCLILVTNICKHRKGKCCTVRFRNSSKVPQLIIEELKSSADILTPASHLLTMRKKLSSPKHILSTLT